MEGLDCSILRWSEIHQHLGDVSQNMSRPETLSQHFVIDTAKESVHLQTWQHQPAPLTWSLPPGHTHWTSYPTLFKAVGQRTGKIPCAFPHTVCARSSLLRQYLPLNINTARLVLADCDLTRGQRERSISPIMPRDSASWHVKYGLCCLMDENITPTAHICTAVVRYLYACWPSIDSPVWSIRGQRPRGQRWVNTKPHHASQQTNSVFAHCSRTQADDTTSVVQQGCTNTTAF